MKRLNEQNLFELVRKLEFPPVEFTIAEEMPRFQSRELKGDFLAEIKWANKSYKFLVEVKNQATPKMIDTAIYQLKDYISAFQTFNSSENYYPLLIAPYLSEERLKRLASENISGIDLSGNGLVIVPGELFVYRFGAKNKFPSNAPIKNVYRGVSSIIPRVFFTKPEYANATEILNQIAEKSGKTTLATVSKVLKSLEEELIISRKNLIRLIDAKNLLKNLRENYRRPIVEKRIFGKTDDLDDTLLQISKNAEREDFLFAVNEPRRYSVMPSSNAVTRIFTENINKLLAEVNFNEQERFSNLEIIETQDPTVYFDRRYELASGCYFASPLQIYLELTSGGKREKETAGQIEEAILNFRY